MNRLLIHPIRVVVGKNDRRCLRRLPCNLHPPHIPVGQAIADEAVDIGVEGVALGLGEVGISRGNDLEKILDGIKANDENRIVGGESYVQIIVIRKLMLRLNGSNIALSRRSTRIRRRGSRRRCRCARCLLWRFLVVAGFRCVARRVVALSKLLA